MQLDNGVEIDDIQVGLQLTKLKSVHTGWIVEFYNYMSMLKRKEIIDNGWKSTGIFDGLELGSNKMPSINLFQDIDPMLSNDFEQSDDSHLLVIYLSQLKNLKHVEARFKKLIITPTLNEKKQKIKFP